MDGFWNRSGGVPHKGAYPKAAILLESMPDLTGAAMDFFELKVLVVEDNQTMRTLIGSVLHGIGVRDIVTATDGMHGLRILMSENPDVVVVDWEMPNFDGIQFTRMVRTSPNVP